MRIDPLGFTKLQNSSGSGVTKVDSERVKSSEGSPSSSEATFTPTEQLVQLLALVRSTPEVRTDVVEDVARRLALGELDSEDVRRQTAEALIDKPY